MRISDEVLVHPDRYDDLLMFTVAFVSEIFFAGSGRPLYGCFIFWALQVCRSFHLRHPWDGFLLLRPSQRKKWRRLRQFIARLGAPVIGKRGKKTTDDRRTGQAWILDLKKNSIFRHPVSWKCISYLPPFKLRCWTCKNMLLQCARNANCLLNCLAPENCFFFRKTFGGKVWEDNETQVMHWSASSFWVVVLMMFLFQLTGTWTPWGMGHG